MKDSNPEKIRNIAFVAHQGAGKTLLTEALLLKMGIITRMGAIEEGNTASDYQQDEISRQISISTTLVHGYHKDCKINVLDTPGFSDFVGEVKAAIRVSDAVGVLVHAVSGIEVGTDLVWSYCDERNVPKFIVINQLDKENADFDKIYNSLVERFASVVPLQFAVNHGSEGFNQIVDLINKKLITVNADGTETKSDIPANLSGKADEMRRRMMETVAESDDDLMEKFFENDGLTDEEILKGLRKGLRENTLFPVLCAAGKKVVGITMLLDFIAEIVSPPSLMPPEIASIEGEDKTVDLECNPAGPVAAFVFKTISDKHVGDLSFFRVYSGTLKSGEELRNTKTSNSEKIGQIFAVTGKTRRALEGVVAGDMGALVKLKNTHTNDTLSSPKERFVLDTIKFPTPNTRICVEPRNKGDEEKMSNALHILVAEDPSFSFHFDTELVQLLCYGQGELHLNIIIERMKDRFSVEVDQKEPRIAYRETIRGSAEGQGKYKKQSGGKGQYGDCWLKLESMPRGSNFEFVDAIVGGVIPGKFIPAIEKGVRGAMEEGVLSGNQVVDVKVTCYDGSHHTVDSSENAFKIAGSMGFKKLFREAKPVILEPIEDLEIRVPEEFMGDVMGDISSRRGKIMGMDSEGRFQIIKAKVPQAELYKYSSTLRSLTGGRGIFKSSFSHFEEVPMEVQNKLAADYEARRAEGN